MNRFRTPEEEVSLTGEAPAKSPPPGLDARAPRPAAVRMRGAAVKAVALVGVLLVSGSLAWAFVVQPELRESARARKAAGREAAARAPVRPAEEIAGQPASYDRLPEPRTSTAREPGTVEEPGAAGAEPRPSAVPGPAAARQEASAGPSPADLAARSGLFFPAASPSDAVPPDRIAAPGGPGRGPGEVASGLAGPPSPYTLLAGTVMPAALLTAVDTARNGPVVAVLTRNVYDTVTGGNLLAPQGSRLIGRSGGDSAWGDRRAFVTWERLILPNGRSLDLGGEAAVDAQGAVGLPGRADRRLIPLLTGVLLGGAVTALGQVARDGDGRGGLLGDAGDAASIEGARVGGRLVEREIEVRPSIRVEAGAAVQVLLTRDLAMERYRP